MAWERVVLAGLHIVRKRWDEQPPRKKKIQVSLERSEVVYWYEKRCLRLDLKTWTIIFFNACHFKLKNLLKNQKKTMVKLVNSWKLHFLETKWKAGNKRKPNRPTVMKGAGPTLACVSRHPIPQKVPPPVDVPPILSYLCSDST